MGFRADERQKNRHKQKGAFRLKGKRLKADEAGASRLYGIIGQLFATQDPSSFWTIVPDLACSRICLARDLPTASTDPPV